VLWGSQLLTPPQPGQSRQGQQGSVLHSHHSLLNLSAFLTAVCTWDPCSTHPPCVPEDLLDTPMSLCHWPACRVEIRQDLWPLAVTCLGLPGGCPGWLLICPSTPWPQSHSLL
jgi:hypothetical protein